MTILLGVVHGRGDVVVSLHHHTTFSDGTQDPGHVVAAALEDAQLVGIADHAEVVNEAKCPGGLTQVYQVGRKAVGVKAWAEEITRINEEHERPVVIPGMELGLLRKKGRHALDRQSHLLVFGGSPNNTGKLITLYGQLIAFVQSTEAMSLDPDEVGKCLERIRSVTGDAAVLIAAHPLGVPSPNFDLGPVGVFELDPGQVDGIEFFNGYGSAADLLADLVHRVRTTDGRPCVAVAGCDTHVPGPLPCDKQTIVLTDDADPEQVVAYIGAGACYAAQDGARITHEGTNAWPGGEFRPTQPLTMGLRLPRRTAPYPAPVVHWKAVGDDRSCEQGETKGTWIKGDQYSTTLDLRTLLSEPMLERGCYLYVVVGDRIAASGIRVLPRDAPPGGPRRAELSAPILVLDRSGSMSAALQELNAKAEQCVEVLLGRAPVMAVVNFRGRQSANVDASFADGRDLVLNAIRDPSEGSGGTAVYDAVIGAVNQARAGGQKAMVILMTDGEDNESRTQLGDAIVAAQRQGVPCVVVGFCRDEQHRSQLDALAKRTTGWFFTPEQFDPVQFARDWVEFAEAHKKADPTAPDAR
jgi:Mg-chelatase subunit ChlD